VTLTSACLPLTLLQAAASAAPAGSPTAAGQNWSVTRVAGGFRVTLDLDQQLPVTANAPTLWVDGENFGPATESADGRSLSLVTTDPAVLGADAVTTDAVDPPSSGADAAGVPRPTEPHTAKPLPADPGELGSHQVTEAVYVFGDQAVPLLNIGGIRGELEGKIYLPDGRGPKPVVIFQHGRHASCYGPGQANPARWPCRATADSTQQRFPVPSYLGYDAPARALASNGYAVVSISANAINANDNQLAPDSGAQARGQLVLDTLRMLQGADAGRNPVYHDAFTDRDVSLSAALTGGLTSHDLIGKFDLRNVGIMGHSRGGEGVVAASTLNDALPVARQFGIRAVLPLAPVDFSRISLPNVPTATILPYCDGDVRNLIGQHFADDSRHSFSDNVLRSTVLVMGANHNFFNTIWTPGGFPASTSDDWPASDHDPVCDPTAATTTRLTPTEQVAVGTAYIAGFFRLTLGGQRQFLPMYDGSSLTPPSTAFAHITAAATAPARSRVDINTFSRADAAVRAYGDATAVTCASMGGQGGLTLPPVLPFCATTLNSSALPHWTPGTWAFNVPAAPMLHLRWTSATGQVRVAVPRSARDIRRYDQLSVKMAADEFVPTGTDLTLGVVDGRGRTWSAPVSQLNPQAVTRLPGVTSAVLRKVILRQVTIPTSLLRRLDLGDIREVRFTAATGADGSPAGGVYISDLSAENPALGARVPAQLSTVDMAAARVEEGAGPGTAALAVVLSRPTAHPVTAYVNVFGSATGKAGLGMQKVTFAPGQTCLAVTTSTFGDTLPSATAATSFKVSVTTVAGAVMGDHGFSTLTVREDDGVTAGVPAPTVGIPGEPCAEYKASLHPGRLRVTGSTAAGSTVLVTAAGYRSGESVELRLGATVLTATVLGAALADGNGEVSFIAVIPAGTPPGKAVLTATGAGSAHADTANVNIRPAH
jgi:trimeric autotransporter adhesin